MVNGSVTEPDDPIHDDYYGTFDRQSFEHDVEHAHRKKIKSFRKKSNKTNATLYNACSVPVHINVINPPFKIIWTILKGRLDTASSSVGRQALYLQFISLRPELLSVIILPNSSR